MAGIPITAGFAGKYLLFSGAFHAHAWLVIVALVGSAISIAYYFRILKAVWFTSESGVTLNSSLGEKLLLGLSLIIILGLGIVPSVITGLQYFKAG
jgi:NADH-quinone oxidoreductase subunit N